MARSLALSAAGGGRPSSIAGSQRRHPHLALRADQQRVQLQVVVGDAGLVREGQALTARGTSSAAISIGAGLG